MFLIVFLLAACGGGGGSSGGSGGPGGSSAVLVSLAIAPANPTLLVGANVPLIATGTFSDGSARDLSGSVTWTSGATQVATVTAAGVVSAVAPGSATITATSGAILNSTTVTVAAPPPTVSLSFIHVFQAIPSDGGQPNGPLLQASDGNFYGTTRAGGANLCMQRTITCGTVVRVAPSGNESVLYSFGASASDGWNPNAPLIQGSDGALYGTTSRGGTHDAGTVFKITLSGAYTVLYSFGASPSDGAVPVAALVQASDGNFYGTTSSGGANHCVNIPQAGGNCGTVFRMTPAGNATVLYSFGSSPSDGVTPLGSLIQASDGNLYGTTINGGANNCTFGGTHDCGTVFRITLAGAMTTVHSFGAFPGDGIAPQGPLIQASDGALYGTTPSGGGCTFCGTVFRVTLAGQETIFHSFGPSRPAGTGPSPFLIQARDGNFYGTTRSGGFYQSDSNGTAFRLTPSGSHTLLYSFGPLNTNPSDPGAGLTQGSDGAFYGVTFNSGSLNGSGAVFKMVVQ